MIKNEENNLVFGGDGKRNKRMTAQEREKILVENFVGLQHAMTNLSIKFSALSENINKLLQIFEEAAKGFSPAMEKSGDSETNNDLIKKIDSLIDQNRTIAQGLVIMEEKLRLRTEPFSQTNNEVLRPRLKPLPDR